MVRISGMALLLGMARVCTRLLLLMVLWWVITARSSRVRFSRTGLGLPMASLFLKEGAFLNRREMRMKSLRVIRRWLVRGVKVMSLLMTTMKKMRGTMQVMLLQDWVCYFFSFFRFVGLFASID